MSGFPRATGMFHPCQGLREWTQKGEERDQPPLVSSLEQSVLPEPWYLVTQSFLPMLQCDLVNYVLLFGWVINDPDDLGERRMLSKMRSFSFDHTLCLKNREKPRSKFLLSFNPYFRVHLIRNFRWLLQANFLHQWQGFECDFGVRPCAFINCLLCSKFCAKYISKDTQTPRSLALTKSVLYRNTQQESLRQPVKGSRPCVVRYNVCERL